MKFITGLFLFCLAFGQAAANAFEEGVHYKKIQSSEKYQEQGVTEFFSLYCVHCYRYEPIAKSFEQRFKEDFKKIHVSSVGPGGNTGELMTRGFILSELLGISEEISKAIYHANFVEKEILDSKADIKNTFLRHGVTAEAFERGYESFSVKTRLAKWQRMTDDYGVRATPTFVVNGTYMIDPMSFRESGDFEGDMLRLAEYLLSKTDES